LPLTKLIVFIIKIINKLVSMREKEIFPEEKRLSPRFKIPGATVSYRIRRLFFKKKNYDEEFCPLQDLSRGGVRFVCRRKLKPKTRLFLQLSIPGERTPLLLLGEVRWSSKNSNESYPFQVGIQFNPYGQGKNLNYPGNLVKIISLEHKFIELELDTTISEDEYKIDVT